MTEFPITPRENWIRAMKHEMPYWMPMFSDTQLILPNIIPDVVARAMIMEAEPVPPDYLTDNVKKTKNSATYTLLEVRAE